MAAVTTPIHSSAVQPVNPACFSRRKIDACIDLVAGTSKAAQTGLSRSCNSTPQRFNQSLFRPVFWRPKKPRISGRQALHPVPQPAVGVVVSEPFWDDRRGPKTHSRRTGRKLGQLRCARQELVRVPESNTKYGGKRGKTGVGHPPVMDASISESSGIPKRKKFPIGVSTRLGPAVHRRSIFSRLRIAFSGLR